MVQISEYETLPKNWQIRQIKEIGKVTTGKTPSTNDPKNFEGTTPFITPGDVKQEKFIKHTVRFVSDEAKQNLTILPPQSIIVTCIGNIGKIAITTSESTTNQQINSLILNQDKNNVDYAYYVIQRFFPMISSRLVGFNVVPIVNKSEFEKVTLPIPPLPEQVKIAAILSAVDDTINKMRFEKNKITRLKMGLIQKMFQNGYQNNHMEIIETKYNKNPISWEVNKLENVANIVSGFTKNKNKKYSINSIKIPYVTVVNVKMGHLDLTKVSQIEMNESDFTRFKLEINDIIMTEGGDPDKLGRGVIWEGEIPNCSFQNHIFRVRCHQNLILPRFLHYYLQSHYAKKYFFLNSKQTSNLASINMTDLKNFPVPVPTIEEQRQIVKILVKVDSLIFEIDVQIKKFSRIKAGLMQKLLNGKMRVQIN